MAETNNSLFTVSISHIFNGYKSSAPIPLLTRTVVSNTSTLESHPSKRRQSLNQFYQHEASGNLSFLSRTTTGSSLHSKDLDNDRWEWDATEKGFEDYLILSRYTEYERFTEDISDVCFCP